MRQKTVPQTSAAEKTIKDIRRATRKHHSSEEKIRRLIATRSPFCKGHRLRGPLHASTVFKWGCAAPTR